MRSHHAGNSLYFFAGNLCFFPVRFIKNSQFLLLWRKRTFCFWKTLLFRLRFRLLVGFAAVFLIQRDFLPAVLG